VGRAYYCGCQKDALNAQFRSLEETSSLNPKIILTFSKSNKKQVLLASTLRFEALEDLFYFFEGSASFWQLLYSPRQKDALNAQFRSLEETSSLNPNIFSRKRNTALRFSFYIKRLVFYFQKGITSFWQL